MIIRIFFLKYKFDYATSPFKNYSLDSIVLGIKHKLLYKVLWSLLSILLLQHVMKQPPFYFSFSPIAGIPKIVAVSQLCLFSLITESSYILFPWFQTWLSTFFPFWISTFCLSDIILKRLFPTKPALIFWIRFVHHTVCSISNFIVLII